MNIFGFKNMLAALSRFAVMMVAMIALTPRVEAAETWRINPARTKIAFSIDAVGYGTTEGRFQNFEGNLSLDFEKPSASKVMFKVQTASIKTGSNSMDAYIKSAVMLDVAQYPEMRFTSTRVEKTSAKSLAVTGDLTFYGTTMPATFSVTVSDPEKGAKEKKLTFTANGTVKRSAHGFISGQPLVSDDVLVSVSTEASGE